MLRLHFFQHITIEGPASITAWASERGHPMIGTELFRNASLPSIADFDALVVMGGPMSVHDEHRFPWLTDEKRLIESALQAGKPVLGICLGAELIADVLGARVYRNPEPEIGWFSVHAVPDAANSPVWRGFPDEFPAFHWHFDAFDLPRDAQHLAFSEATPVQAFAYGSAVGLLCHLEMDRAGVERLIQHHGHEIGSGPFEQSPEQMLCPVAPFAEARRALWRLLDNLLGHPPL